MATRSARAWPTEEVITAAQSGDVQSIEILVADTYPHVRRFAFSLCANRHDAEDATQEAMTILFSKIGTLRTARAFAAWIFRIVRNECLRRARAIVTRDGSPLDTAVPSAEQQGLDRLEIKRLAAAIAGLPEDQRRVLVMRDVQGLSGAAVATHLGLSTPAMKSRLHRARAAVREAMA